MAHKALATYSHGNNLLPRSSYELGSINSIQVMKPKGLANVPLGIRLIGMLDT